MFDGDDHLKIPAFRGFIRIPCFWPIVILCMLAQKMVEIPPSHISWRPQSSSQMSKEEFKDAARCLPCLRQTILRHVNIGYKIHILWSTSTIVTISQVCVVAYVFFWHDFGFGIRETSGTTDVGPFADDSDLGYHWHMIPSKMGKKLTHRCLADSFSGYIFLWCSILKDFQWFFAEISQRSPQEFSYLGPVELNWPWAHTATRNPRRAARKGKALGQWMASLEQC